MGHAKIILSLNNSKEQIKLFEKIIQNELSVREVENVKKISKQGKKNIKVNPNLEEKEEVLREILGTKIKILSKEKGGQIIIEYYSDEELKKLIKKIIK